MCSKGMWPTGERKLGFVAPRLPLNYVALLFPAKYVDARTHAKSKAFL